MREDKHLIDNLFSYMFIPYISKFIISMTIYVTNFIFLAVERML